MRLPVLHFAVSICALCHLGNAEAAETQSCPAEPVIDVHLHAYDTDPRFDVEMPMPRSGATNPATDGVSHRRLTLAALQSAGVVRGVVSSQPLRAAQVMVDSEPDRLMLGYSLMDIPTADDLERIRELHNKGHLAMIGEVAPQYLGIAPDDPGLEPLWQLANELNIPVGYHMGSGPPLITQFGYPEHRAAVGVPLLIEDVLVRYPNLRLLIMHGGFPYGDATHALLNSYPQVFIDLGAVHFAEHPGAFHGYLRRLVEAGFADRILFGSDQMVWPDAVAASVQAYRDAPYLTDDQRAGILYEMPSGSSGGQMCPANPREAVGHGRLVFHRGCPLLGYAALDGHVADFT